MASINYYNISNLFWYPIDFNIIGNQYNLIKTPITFSNGMSFNLFNCLNDPNDLSFNNKTGIFLTSFFNNTGILIDSNHPSIINTLNLIESPLASYNGNIFSIVNNSFLLTHNSTFSLNDKLIFNFEKNHVSIQNLNGYYLTDTNINSVNSNTPLVFEKQKNLFDPSQNFDYLLGDGYITIYRNGSNYSVIMTELNNGIVFQILNPQIVNLPLNCIFKLPSYIDNDRNFSSISDSFTVTYEANPLLNTNDLIINNKDKNYIQNYLGVFPYEKYSIENNVAFYDLYFHALKNYQTSDYLYTNYSTNRTYNKIFTGTNQTNGLNRIHLGYQTNTIKIDFPPDKNTKFYYSPTSTITHISAAGFIENGAIAGVVPLISDRILQNTLITIPELTAFNMLLPLTNDNRWLCSWLYQPEDGSSPVWLDRYYNPAYYSLDKALSATQLVYNKFLYPEHSYCYDIPSTMNLIPNVLYQYHHVGKNDNDKFLSCLNYNYNTNSYSQILSITNWLSAPLNDDSTYNNDGLVYNNSITNFKGNYWNLDGSNYAIFPAKQILLQDEKLSVSMWVKVDDWADVQGNQIFGNYYNSGFGLINESSAFAPIITIINNQDASIQNLNYRFANVSNPHIKTNFENYNFNFVQRLTDYNYWVFDSVNLIAIKYNVDDQIITSILIPRHIKTINQVEIDSNENLYIYDNTTKTYVVLDSNGNYKYYKTLSNNINGIQIGLDNQVRSVYGNVAVIDNNNNLWEVIGSNLYINHVMYATVGQCKQITCDRNNNIWIITNNDYYIKIDKNGKIVFNINFKNDSLLQTNCQAPSPIVTTLTAAIREDLPFLSTNNDVYIDSDDINNDIFDILITEPLTSIKYPKPPLTTRVIKVNFISSPVNSNVCSSSQQEDQLVMIDETDNMIYLIGQNGNPISKLSFSALPNSKINSLYSINGDFTGYQYLRKYQSIHNRISWKFKIANKNGNNSRLLSLLYPTSSLPNGWHHFAFSFDATQGIANYYINGITVDSVKFTPNQFQLYYDYRTSLLLGSTTVKNSILNNFLNSDQGYRFIGSVADLRMYSTYLKQDEINQIYRSSEFSPNATTLNWNMLVGNRNYVEEIKHYFKFQMPGSKSKYYNINIHNFKNSSIDVKQNIEIAIRNIINKISPSHTSLFNINWL